MWDVNEPRRDEVRASGGETPPHRSRKNTRRWCRGKPGVEHTPEVRLSKHAVYLAARWPERQACGWNHWWKRINGKSVPDETTWHWSCGHELGCSTCGKVLTPFLRKECPDFHERN